MELLAGLHPRVVHFPLAFLMLYPVIELLALVSKKDFFSKTANLFLFIGTLGAFLAVFTGNQAYLLADNWHRESLIILNAHQTFANYTMWFYAALLAFRIYLYLKKKLNQKIILLLFLLSLFGSYLVYQTGYFGGKLARVKTIELNSGFRYKQ